MKKLLSVCLFFAVFACTAVSDDPDCGDVVEITDGVFKNIPYTLVEDPR